MSIPVMTPADLIEGLDVHPFARAIWNSYDDMQRWKPILDRARHVHDLAEYEMVRQGARRCATLHISPHDYDHVMERIQKDKLVWLPIQRTRSYNGFSHRHFPVDKLDQNSSVYGVLACSLEDAEAFRAASGGRQTDHRAIGELLGFPECCTQTFCERWPIFFDPIYQAAEACAHDTASRGDCRALLVKPHVATHQMLRYAGYRLTSHLPCRLDCPASIEVGKTWLEVARRADPQGTDALLEILALPGEWSVLHGVAVVETPHFTLVTNSLPTRTKFAVIWGEVAGYGGDVA